MPSADDTSAETRMRLLEGAQLCWVHANANPGRSMPQISQGPPGVPVDDSALTQTLRVTELAPTACAHGASGSGGAARSSPAGSGRSCTMRPAHRADIWRSVSVSQFTSMLAA